MKLWQRAASKALSLIVCTAVDDGDVVTIKVDSSQAMATLEKLKVMAPEEIEALMREIEEKMSDLTPVGAR